MRLVSGGFMRVILVALALGLAPITTAQAQENSGFSDLPPPCGTEQIAIARMQWPSSAVLAEIHAALLADQLGCKVAVIAGDLTATGSSMATTQQPAAVPEMWIARIPDIWNSAIEAQAVRQAGNSFSGGAMEGWFIPGFVSENHPGLTSAAVLKDYWKVFRTTGTKARFVSCPPDWACAVINRNLIKALGLDGLFEIVEPESRFEMDRLIGDAMSRREPILFYYWQPNAVLAQFEFLQLDLGAFDAEAFSCLGKVKCAVPRPSGFAPEPVVVALADWVFKNAPQVAAYFQRAQMPLDVMNGLLAWQGENGKSAEEVAAHFIATRRDIWSAWFGQVVPETE